MASKIKGIISTRRLLRRVPDEMRNQLGDAMRSAGPELANAMQARVPRATGRLAAGIMWRFSPSQLTLRVGFIGKLVNRKLFYNRIIEWGRKGQTVTVRRRKAGVGKRLDSRTRRKRFDDIVAVYQLRVKPRAPHHFVYGPATDLRVVLGRKLNGIWDRVLQRVSGGGDE